MAPPPSPCDDVELLARLGPQSLHRHGAAAIAL
jgi:hypothetical protein